MRRLIVLLLLLTAAPAWADGGPVPPLDGGAGVGTRARPDRYVTIALDQGTLLQRLRHGKVTAWRMLPGSLGVPGAAFDGSMTGLSADGRTLVLAAIARRYPQRRTTLVVVDARRLHVRERVHLRGFFTVDAVSPDGRRLYLLHYAYPRNGLRYEVRAYDLAGHRLVPEPIVDPREPDEKMLGLPYARTTSDDGRWVYTLYGSPDHPPFVHALDTRAGTAACIDLDGLPSADPSTLHLVAPIAGEPLRVVSSAGAQAVIDRRTFKVSTPAAAPAHSTPAAAPAGDGPWPLIGAAAALVLLAAWAVRSRRPRTPTGAPR
jgi:hypothetical protein